MYVLCTCMYIRMYVCMYVCKYVCMYVCKYVCMYVRTYVCMYARMYIPMYVSIIYINFIYNYVSNDYRDLLKVHTVPDFYTKALELVDQLKTGNLISTEDFIQVLYN